MPTCPDGLWLANVAGCLHGLLWPHQANRQETGLQHRCLTDITARLPQAPAMAVWPQGPGDARILVAG